LTPPASAGSKHRGVPSPEGNNAHHGLQAVVGDRQEVPESIREFFEKYKNGSAARPP